LVHIILLFFQRIKEIKKPKRKAFLDTNKIIVAYNHGAFYCYKNASLNGKCQKLSRHSFSQVNHYRSKVYRRETNETVLDMGIWRFKDELITAVNETLIATNFVP
jgi:hypothetical protein